MCALFACVGESDDHLATLEEMWRHPVSDTRLVLDALGHIFPTAGLPRPPAKPLCDIVVGWPTSADRRRHSWSGL
jgi:hypothetical protein